MKTLTHVIVKGLVQGVCFRATAKKRADEFGIFGTIKNLPDGSVEMILQGNDDLINAYLESLKASAGIALVEAYQINTISSEKTFNSFEIIS